VKTKLKSVNVDLLADRVAQILVNNTCALKFRSYITAGSVIPPEVGEKVMRTLDEILWRNDHSVADISGTSISENINGKEVLNFY